ncbi:MAG: hypothetical protein U9P10_07550 [Thermodesulfobacteriota bacterium]|nr:hypothetical protein [Thermodesulfobacteriota bacterium]
MTIKIILGVLIIVLNLAGLIFALSMGIIHYRKKFAGKKTNKRSVKPLKKKKQMKEVNIKEDQDEIMKDMNLSDFDDLNFDDAD